MATSDAARARAEDSVSTRFTRLMNATTSRWGVLTDPSIVGAATAPPVVALVIALRLEASPALILGLKLLAAGPIFLAVAVSLALLGARRQVIEWLAGLPFPVENLNAVLNGLGDELEVVFAGEVPESAEINRLCEAVSAESFVTKLGPEGREPEPDERRWVEIRVGVVDSKRNPAGTNHQRFERVRALVGDVLVPLAARAPIVAVRVK
jgi:hypothetical protein